MCYRAGKYAVCRRVRVSFTPEIVQAGTVKGLVRLILAKRFSFSFARLKAAVYGLNGFVKSE